MNEQKQPAVAGPVEPTVRPVAWLAPATGQVYRADDITDPESWAIPLYRFEDAAAVERARWESAIGAEMPADFKDWHQNAASERPEVAAWVIRNLREREALAWSDK